MRPEVPATHLYRFGLFEADVRNGRLLRHGARVKLQEQPFRVLAVLLRSAGEIVTREQLRQELWPSDTYVEFEGGLNSALKRLRSALGDSADNPTLLPAEAGGKPAQVLAMSIGGLVGWAPDGQSLLFWQAAGPDGRLGLYAINLKSREVTKLPGSEGLHHGSVSPDGLHIAALNETDRSIVLYDLQSHQTTELAQGVAIVDPYWSHDSRVVFFQDIRAGLDQPIYRVRIDDRKVERVTNFAQPLATDVTSYRLTGITPDDQVLASMNRSNSDLYALDVDFP